MDKSLKGIAIAAAALVVIGILLAGIGYLSGGNRPVFLDHNGIHIGGKNGAVGGELADFSEETGSFTSIDVDLGYHDVDLVPSDKFEVKGTYFSKEGKPYVKVENGTLVVKDPGRGKVKLSIDIPGLNLKSSRHPEIKIYYPKDTKFQDISIQCGMSDLSFEKLSAEKVRFDVDYGKLDLSDITAGEINVDMSCGDCTLKNMNASGALNVSNDLGKVTLNGADVKNLKVESSSGSVSLTEAVFDSGDLNLDLGKLSAEKIKSKGLRVRSSSGDVELRGELLGLTDVSSDMGKVTINPGLTKDQFNYDLSTDMGAVYAGGDKAGGSFVSSNASAKNTLKVRADMGDVRVEF